MPTRPREKAQRTKKGVEVFLGCGMLHVMYSAMSSIKYNPLNYIIIFSSHKRVVLIISNSYIK